MLGMYGNEYYAGTHKQVVNITPVRVALGHCLNHGLGEEARLDCKVKAKLSRKQHS